MKKELQEAIEAARGLATLLKSQMAFDFTAPTSTPNAHHKAYTRRTRSGATSQIQARGAQHPAPTSRDEAIRERDGASKEYAEQLDREGRPVVVQHATPHAGHRIPPPPSDGEAMPPGTIVKFHTPVNDSEAALRHRVLEDRGDRVQVQDATPHLQHLWPGNLVPTTVLRKTDLVKVDDTDAAVINLIDKVGLAAQGILSNPAMAPHKAEIEEMISDLKKYPSARHAQVVIEQMKELGESVAKPANPYQGNPQKLLDDITSKMKVTFGTGPHKTALQFTVRHDENMVTIGYKAEHVSRGEALAIGNQETMSGQRLRQQKEAFAASAPRILREIKKKINVEDAAIELDSRPSIFFLSNDMIKRPA